MLDVFFISMGEVGSEENWNRLLEFAPDAKKVTNVTGIYEVHKACAELSTTENFWVVDADAWIVDGFKFTWEPDPNKKHWNIPETECVLVWPSRNPVNGLEYGYGGVKLFPRAPFLEKHTWEIDLSTTIGRATVVMGHVSCETRFNSSPESAWIGAFRECAKLASLSMIKSKIRKAKFSQQYELEELNEFVMSQDWEDSKKDNYRSVKTLLIQEKYAEDLDIFKRWNEIESASWRKLIWCTEGWNNYNGKYAVLGAQSGSNFGLIYSDDPSQINLINDWSWLKKEFKNVNV